MEDGYFKIRRGKNECGIEEDVTAGWPSTKNLVIEALLGDPQPLGEQQRVVEVIGCIATELGWVGELLDRLRSLQILLRVQGKSRIRELVGCFDLSPLQLLFVHLYLKEISMGVYRKVHRIIKYLKLKRMNPSIEHRELMLA
ncbi:hypothetical protein JHK86_050361 [Glycine max]|nr:hypothetical protein JHK86_050361 [Glycine max]